MLSKEEKDFILYWEQNRLRRKKVFRQFLVGIPIGLLFVIPIVLNFLSGWHKSADVEANSPDFDPRVLFVALLLIVAFTSIFYQRHKWDQYEQRYRELLARRSRDAHSSTNAPAAGPGTRPDPAISPATPLNPTGADTGPATAPPEKE